MIHRDLLLCASLMLLPATGVGVQAGRGEAASTATSQAQVDNLLADMTPAEKMGQLSQLFILGKSAATEAKIERGEIGSVLFLTDPAEINRIQRIAVEKSRLHIPLLFGLDVIHGFRTVFPVPIAMAASWDPKVEERAQAVAAQEARAAGVQWTFAPMVDIARDPRWGRIVEGAGEDPFLGSVMAQAQVRGFQGPAIGTEGRILATAKHFAGYGAAQGGRDYDGVEISDSELWNVYLPPFRSAVEAGTATIMSAYMDLNGVPATGNAWLLRDVLRKTWGFQGFVVSDADAVKSLKTHGFAADNTDAALRAFHAGVNMEMAIGNSAYSSGLPAAFQAGQITDQQLNNAVRPILEMKARMGLFEHPYVDEEAAKRIESDPEHRVEAMHAAERSAVLLRNQGNLLPLASDQYKKIAVVGSLADSQIDMAGSWVFANDPAETVTVLQGIRSIVSPSTEVLFAPAYQIARKFASPFDALIKGKRPPAWTEQQAKEEFTKAVALAGQSDLVILTLGERQEMSGESASRSSLELPGNEEQLMEAIAATGKPVVLVLLNGRPLNISWASEHIPAILDAWYGGTDGGKAVANLLFGKVSPGGKLPFTWPRNVGQVPIFYAHGTTHSPLTQGKRYWNEESTPLFPFGFGLSYSHFEFSNLRVMSPQVKIGQNIELTVDVANAGNTAADEVVQLYLHQQYGQASRPVRELQGFERVSLAPQEKKTVRFTVTPRNLSYWSSAAHSVVQDASPFDLWIGDDATATLHGSFIVTPSR